MNDKGKMIFTSFKSPHKFTLSCFIFCWFFISSYLCFSQSREIDSLINILKSAKEDTNKVNYLNDLGRLLMLNSDFDAALVQAQRAKTLSETLNYKKGIANSYNNLGNIANDRGNYSDALNNHLFALKIRKEIGDKKGIAGSYNNSGLAYWRKGEYPKALENYFSAMKIAEELNNKNGMALLYNNIGLIYKEQQNYPEALKNYFSSLKIRKEMNHLQGIGVAYTNIGTAYYLLKNYDEALKYHFLFLEISEQTNDRERIADAQVSIAIIYDSQGKFNDAYNRYLNSLKVYEALGSKQRIAMANVNLGSVSTKIGNLKLSKKYLDNALTLSKEIGSKDFLKICYRLKAELDSTRGDFKSAFVNHKLFIAYQDSLLNEENTKKTVRAQMRFDFDKKQTADSIRNAERLKQKQLIHEEEIKQQKIFTYGGVLGFLLMLVVAGISFRAYKQKQKTNLIISAQKRLVEEHQKEIIDSIRYAQRIQQALLPNEKSISKNLKRLKDR